MGVLFWFAVFAVSLYLLLKASDFFVDSSVNMGSAFGIAPYVIGVTIVALGTSLPELATSLMAVLQGEIDVPAGNVVGSNIANILLVLGISAIVAKVIPVKLEDIRGFMNFLILSAVFLLFTALDGQFTRIEAIGAVLLMILYLWYTVRAGTSTDDVDPDTDKFRSKDLVIFLISAVLIPVAAKFLIDSVINISTLINIGTDTIAQSFISLGTSLPELFVCVACVRKGQTEMAIGNVLGSNIFNTFAVMGIPGLLSTLQFTNQMLNFSLPLMALATTLFFLFTWDGKVKAWEGIIAVLLYFFFFIYIFI